MHTGGQEALFLLIQTILKPGDEIIVRGYQSKDKDCDETKARVLVAQVNARDYSPPKRERILEGMKQQGFQSAPMLTIRIRVTCTSI